MNILLEATQNQLSQQIQQQHPEYYHPPILLISEHREDNITQKYMFQDYQQAPLRNINTKQEKPDADHYPLSQTFLAVPILQKRSFNRFQVCLLATVVPNSSCCRGTSRCKQNEEFLADLSFGVDDSFRNLLSPISNFHHKPSCVIISALVTTSGLVVVWTHAKQTTAPTRLPSHSANPKKLPHRRIFSSINKIKSTFAGTLLLARSKAILSSFKDVMTLFEHVPDGSRKTTMHVYHDKSYIESRSHLDMPTRKSSFSPSLPMNSFLSSLLVPPQQPSHVVVPHTSNNMKSSSTTSTTTHTTLPPTPITRMRCRKTRAMSLLIDRVHVHDTFIQRCQNRMVRRSTWEVTFPLAISSICHHQVVVIHDASKNNNNNMTSSKQNTTARTNTLQKTCSCFEPFISPSKIIMTPLVVRLLLEQFIMLCLHLDASHWKRNHLVAEPQDACIDSVVLPLLRIIPSARFLELFVHALSNAMIITCVTPNHYLSSSNVHFTLWNASQSSHTSCIQKNVGCKGRHYPHLSSNHTILRKCIHSSTYSTPLHSCMMFLLLMELQAPFLESTCIDHGTCITRNGNGSQCRRIQTCIQCCYYYSNYFTRHLGTCTTMDVHVTGREILSSFHQYFDTCLCHALYNHANVSKTARTQLSFSQFLTYMLYSLLYNNFNNNQFTTILSKSSSMIGSDHSRKFTNHSNGDNNNNNTSGRTSRQSNHSSSGSGNIQSSSSSRSSSNSEQQQQQQQVQTGRILTHDHNNTSDHLFALIDIIDGTQKEKNGIKYWVQRNVITIQVISSFVFDTCTINCNKEGSTEVKHMETLSFVDSFAKMNESKIMELNLSTLRSASTEHEIYEAQFRKKLPYTSGRPETQKLIWLSAEFSLNNQTIKTVISPKFYVCSRPQDLRGVTRVGQASSSEETQSSSQSRHAAKMAAQKSVIRGMVSVIPRKQFMAESNPPQQQPSLPPTMTNTTTTTTSTSSRSVNTPPRVSTPPKIPLEHAQNQPYQVQFPSIHPPPVSASALLHSFPSPPSTSSNIASNIYQQSFQQQAPQQQPQYTPSNSVTNHFKTEIFSIIPNRGPLTGMHDVTIFGTFDGLSQNPQHVRVLFGLQDSPFIKKVLPDRIICVAPERIVPGQVRIEVVVPHLSFVGDVFYTYTREPEEYSTELSSVPIISSSFQSEKSHTTSTSNVGSSDSGKLHHQTLKEYQYHPYKH